LTARPIAQTLLVGVNTPRVLIMGRVHVLLAGLLLWMAIAVSQPMAADFSKPGPFAVGMKTFTVADVTGKHPLPTFIWYPAVGPSPDPGAKILDGTKDAPPATTGPYPLVVVIHGLNGVGMSYAPWGTHLASYGFVVLAADYDNVMGSLADEGVSLTDRPLMLILYTRPANVVRLIAYADTLTAPGGQLAGVIDTAHIGVWGHSTGGTTALQAAGAQINFKALRDWCAANEAEAYGESCQFVSHEQRIADFYGSADAFAGPLPPIWDSRVSALALAAPGGELHVFGDDGIAVVKVPTLVMVSSTDAYVKPSLNALWAYAGIGSPDKALAVFDKGGHPLFANYRSKQFVEAESLTTAFFLETLKGDANGKAALQPDQVSFPGLTYETTIH
jgi:predicted dienelactone hydrolase